jgi:hypothetical protein
MPQPVGVVAGARGVSIASVMKRGSIALNDFCTRNQNAAQLQGGVFA